MSLPDSYASLQQHPYIKKESKLTMEFVTKQILMKENSHGDSLLSLLFSVPLDSAKNLGVVFIPDEGSGALRVSLFL